jgi:hypothetical protein
MAKGLVACREGSELDAEALTLQNCAEIVWSRLAPELPTDLLQRVAFNFGAVRRTTGTENKRKLAAEVNVALGYEAFKEMAFGYIVFQEASE